MIAFELNEVPWRILDDYITTRPNSNFARLLSEGASFTTQTPDRGHLSPWITWPTMHRGVENTRHGIELIGQEVDNQEYLPLWDSIITAGKTVGVFGALQSWPPPPMTEGFFVPDMFAKDETCVPRSLSAFQSLNLDLTRRNGRVVDKTPGVGRIVKTLPHLIAGGLRLGTVSKGSAHIIRERIERRYTYRRPVYQAILGFDLFLRQLRRQRPDYASFFTNHVAGLMHRYWRAAYPDDYRGGAVDSEGFYADAIRWGMDVADGHLGSLMRVADARGAVLIIASSMGQAAIEPTDDPTSLKLAQPDLLLKAIGHVGRWKRLYAMEPQVPIEVESASVAGDLVEKVESIKDETGEGIFRTNVQGNVVSLTISPTKAAITSERILIGDSPCALDEAGIVVIHPETPGTAYHIPDGHLIFRGKGIAADHSRRIVSSLQYAPTILGLLGVPRAEYHLEGIHDDVTS